MSCHRGLLPGKMSCQKWHEHVCSPGWGGKLRGASLAVEAVKTFVATKALGAVGSMCCSLLCSRQRCQGVNWLITN